VSIPTVKQVNELVAETYPATTGDGYHCVDIGEGFAVARWTYDPSLDRPGGLISGPTQFTICDSVLWYLSFTVVGLQPMAVTSDLHITFLRPAVGGDLVARAELIRAGRTRIFGEVRVWVDGAEDRPVAHATGSYALLEPR
jgi:uncharacterized protein (TIGR00369 family)